MEKSVNSAEKRKERINISILAKFERDTSEASEDIAPRSRGILKTFVWLGGGGVAAPPYHTNICKILRLSRVISSLLCNKSLSYLA